MSQAFFTIRCQLPEKLQAQSKAPYHPQMASYQSREVSAIYCKVEQASRLLQTVDKVQLNLTPLTETRSMAVEMAKSFTGKIITAYADDVYKNDFALNDFAENPVA
jgi:hypothetical protein